MGRIKEDQKSAQPPSFSLEMIDCFPRADVPDIGKVMSFDRYIGYGFVFASATNESLGNLFVYRVKGGVITADLNKNHMEFVSMLDMKNPLHYLWSYKFTHTTHVGIKLHIEPNQFGVDGSENRVFGWKAKTAPGLYYYNPMLSMEDLAMADLQRWTLVIPNNKWVLVSTAKSCSIQSLSDYQTLFAMRVPCDYLIKPRKLHNTYSYRLEASAITECTFSL